jgi:hypothetical protein
MSEAEAAENAASGHRFDAETRGTEPDAEPGQGPEHGIDRPDSAPMGRPVVADRVPVRSPVVVLCRADEIARRSDAGVARRRVQFAMSQIGVGHTTVQRVWKEHGLEPHLWRPFKLTNDPKFAEKVADIVGLYLNPPDRAVVLCVDEKSQIQVLDRTQPGLPMKKGRAQTMTHDYKRNGTTTLLAALDVKTGKVIGECLPRHRANEFYKTHKTKEVGLARQAPALQAALHANIIVLDQPG